MEKVVALDLVIQEQSGDFSEVQLRIFIERSKRIYKRPLRIPINKIPKFFCAKLY